MLPEQLIQTFMNAVRQQSADVAFSALAELVRATIGTKLLTASVFDMKAMQSRRVFSDNPVAYPVGGFKPISEDKWWDKVLVRHEVFSSLRIEEIAEVFFDWELIQSLGCESNANIPVVVGGEVIGTINLLDEAGYYTPERLASVPALLPYATIAFLLLSKSCDQKEA
ncbi:GAF domain-containing protein [Rhizobium sp. KVB221]|uniref:GAF domain-containing protein n=1 Tax=Rhizobium setariae TaxID=2801340 RepID=A0A937CPN0_9HYPH|nr:GAF domain-containing protein [Rhizobium setariae]MBL0373389.1 GAF domain-containing protein [Rhizobium setariae]